MLDSVHSSTCMGSSYHISNLKMSKGHGPFTIKYVYTGSISDDSSFAGLLTRVETGYVSH
ncbi:MAG: hypothetical protein J07HQW2_01251 [Haloquadratum walsbyi J07HQW2]|uniref:Uncharacterized protein n=1 Tax=Haloquadratum walsbyi J07HQW2 TaxID=1238425 RepID=U1MWJ1_9EURY|nr:MAG: hypothetical protein J07HQW2_01251 [Haloquadratum walsbyi J07HQW2]